MKNKKIIESWNKIKTDRTAHERILNNILDRVHFDTERKRKSFYIRKEYWKILAPVAVCLFIVIAATVPSLIKPGTPDNLNGYIINYSRSGLYVRYIDDLPELPTEAVALTEKSEDALFNEVDTHIFSGTVQSVRNIEINFNGNIQYKAIAKVSVEEVLRGSCASGDIVSILLAKAVNPDVQAENNGVTSYMSAGMKGIFMPYKYDEFSYIPIIDDVQLPCIDLADYGFLDSERYAFLEKQDGLIFARWAYKSVDNAQTLDEIKQYINTMLER